MDNPFIFNFKTDLSKIQIPKQLNNPFGTNIPVIGRIAAQEFQNFIALEAKKWDHDFTTQKGKMFGVLVIQKADKSVGYLGTISGKLLGDVTSNKLIPSALNDSIIDDFNAGMTELTAISHQIKNTENEAKVIELSDFRKQKSHALQQRLFENYQFLNQLGDEKNVLEIFEDASYGKPPSAAGECAAPKLLQYAYKHKLQPIALAEFWWGNAPKSKDRAHKGYYPACQNRCRPILEFMLNDDTLYHSINKN